MIIGFAQWTLESPPFSLVHLGRCHLGFRDSTTKKIIFCRLNSIICMELVFFFFGLNDVVKFFYQFFAWCHHYYDFFVPFDKVFVASFVSTIDQHKDWKALCFYKHWIHGLCKICCHVILSSPIIPSSSPFYFWDLL